MGRRDRQLALTHDLDFRGKNVHIRFPVGTMGDILAWFPYAEEFRKKHGCKVYCSMSRKLAPLFAPAYPKIYFIAAQATSQAKYWNNPRGWIETVDFLKSLGYRGLCIDREKCHGFGRHWNTIPYGAEDFTGDRPLQERVDFLGHADFSWCPRHAHTEREFECTRCITPAYVQDVIEAVRKDISG